MRKNIKKKLVEAIKDQREIFGDDLFTLNGRIKESIPMPKSKSIKVADKTVLVEENSLFIEDFKKAESLDRLYDLIHECRKCPLGMTRRNFVFGVGNENSDVMLIGEAPGAEEDAQGIPFVGRAGKLLTDILKAINFDREEVYIANIIKCRPPNNRNPLPGEMETCFPYLKKQIELIKPKLILCLGLVAANALLNKKLTLSKLRENIYEINDIKVMVTYHPAALLRNPHWKRGCWEDVKKFRNLFDELAGK